MNPVKFHLLAQPALEQYPAKLQQLIRHLQAKPTLTPFQIKYLVEAAQLTAHDLMPWADFAHPVADGYGRKLVFDGGHFEIMVMSWMPGDMSAIHDHGSTQWGAVQCFGFAEHTIYHFTDNGVLGNPIAAPYTPGMVREVDHSLIHQMGNATEMPFLSLHVYGCPGAKGSITGDARIFDLLENAIQYTDGGVFFCLPEAQINGREYGICGDRASVRLHHQQMGDRIRRILKTQLTPHFRQQLQQKLQRIETALAEPSVAAPPTAFMG